MARLDVWRLRGDKLVVPCNDCSSCLELVVSFNAPSDGVEPTCVDI